MCLSVAKRTFCVLAYKKSQKPPISGRRRCVFLSWWMSLEYWNRTSSWLTVTNGGAIPFILFFPHTSLSSSKKSQIFVTSNLSDIKMQLFFISYHHFKLNSFHCWNKLIHLKSAWAPESCGRISFCKVSTDQLIKEILETVGFTQFKLELENDKQATLWINSWKSSKILFCY